MPFTVDDNVHYPAWLTQTRSYTQRFAEQARALRRGSVYLPRATFCTAIIGMISVYATIPKPCTLSLVRHALILEPFVADMMSCWLWHIRPPRSWAHSSVLVWGLLK